MKLVLDAGQAPLARHLAMIDVRAAHLADARDAGDLLAGTGSSDVVDALPALLSAPGDKVLTSDPGDLREADRKTDRTADQRPEPG